MRLVNVDYLGMFKRRGTTNIDVVVPLLFFLHQVKAFLTFACNALTRVQNSVCNTCMSFAWYAFAVRAGGLLNVVAIKDCLGRTILSGMLTVDRQTWVY